MRRDHLIPRDVGGVGPPSSHSQLSASVDFLDTRDPEERVPLTTTLLSSLTSLSTLGALQLGRRKDGEAGSARAIQ